MKKVLKKVFFPLMIGICFLTFFSATQKTVKADTKPILIRLGHILATDSDADQGAKEFKLLVEKNSGGRIEVKIFPNSQLGSDQDMFNAMQMGSLEMELCGDGPINLFEPSFGALTMPFAFRDLNHLYHVYNGPIGESLNQAFVKDKSVRMLGIWARGPRYLTANKEIKKPEDLNGYKLRVPTQATYVETWKRLGATPVAMNLSELYTALQQGVVGGQENPLSIIYSSSFYQVQKYVVNTKHVYGPYMIVISDKFFKGLPDDLKKIVTDAVKNAGVKERALVESEDVKIQKQLESKGMKFVLIDRKPFLDKMKGLPELLEKSQKWTPGLYKQIIDTK